MYDVDLLDSKAFSTIKIDVQGNIECLRTKLQSDPHFYSILPAIVQQELKENKARHVTSGSNALLWLVRSLMFVHSFLRRFIEAVSLHQSVEKCLIGAYEETLMPHHGLVVRSVFSVAIKHSPTRSSFLSSLGLPDEDQKHLSDEGEIRYFQTKIVPALAAYLDPMESCLTSIMNLLKEKHIETDSSSE